MKPLNYLTCIILISVLLISGSAYARMYQWIDPDTSTTQLSGKPPAWYRSAADGPRIFVFDNGRLIDDTAISVSNEVRQRMRQQAFVLVEEDRQKAQEKLTRSKELKQKFEDENKEEELVEQDLQDDVLPEIAETEIEYEAEQKEEQTVSEDQMEQLRKIIADWEKLQAESAKASVEKVLQ